MAPIDTEVIHLKGFIDVPDERVDAITAALPQHIALTRAESGCISFEVTPCNSVKGRFIVDEHFVNQEAFEAHQTRNRASEWYQVSQGIPREYSITVGGETTN